jgi:hypothetical protein
MNQTEAFMYENLRDPVVRGLREIEELFEAFNLDQRSER